MAVEMRPKVCYLELLEHCRFLLDYPKNYTVQKKGERLLILNFSWCKRRLKITSWNNCNTCLNIQSAIDLSQVKIASSGHLTPKLQSEFGKVQ